ncbi:MAG TPA: DUF4013 domain-containing protein [Candidatus Dormibacteraeota bacterium]|nr:DUF4013 domain-containing protein [Candidatus Dormibacteraeota bacterium]
MRLVADSFAWPFRGQSRWTWPIGLVAVLLFPLLFIPLFGYAVKAIRAAEDDASKGPPPWRWSARLLWDGAWVALAVAVSAAPFALGYNPLAAALAPRLGNLTGDTVALFLLLFGWGAVLLLLAPHATTRFAASGNFHDLFDVAAAIRGVGADFATWNLAVAAIVTAWAVGIACVGLLCIGLVPGIFYAILVSTHAAAALHRPGTRPSAG